LVDLGDLSNYGYYVKSLRRTVNNGRTLQVQIDMRDDKQKEPAESLQKACRELAAKVSTYQPLAV
jgi:hypothetical protein